MAPTKHDKHVSDKHKIDYLAKAVEAVMLNALHSEAQLREFEEFRQELLQICQEVADNTSAQERTATTTPTTSLLCIGSMRSGIAIHGSDIDVFLKVTNENGQDLMDALGMPRRLEKELLLKGYEVELVLETRVPILKVYSHPTTQGALQCDISFDGELARHSTHLVRCYARIDTRLREMVIFVKLWAKNRDINCPSKGTLSSYGYVLMVLHYAVNIAVPPLCPNLQQQLSPLRGGAKGVPRECNGYNVQFWRDIHQIQLASDRGMFKKNAQSVASLLRGFFEYFAGGHPGPKAFHWVEEVLSIRTVGGLTRKRDKGWLAARIEKVAARLPDLPKQEIRHRYLLAIEEPFQIDLNVARNVTQCGVCAIRDEFRRATRLIERAGQIGDLTEDIVEKCALKDQYYGRPNSSTLSETDKQIADRMSTVRRRK